MTTVFCTLLRMKNNYNFKIIEKHEFLKLIIMHWVVLSGPFISCFFHHLTVSEWNWCTILFTFVFLLCITKYIIFCFFFILMYFYYLLHVLDIIIIILYLNIDVLFLYGLVKYWNNYLGQCKGNNFCKIHCIQSRYALELLKQTS